MLNNVGIEANKRIVLITNAIKGSIIFATMMRKEDSNNFTGKN